MAQAPPIRGDLEARDLSLGPRPDRTPSGPWAALLALGLATLAAGIACVEGVLLPPDVAEEEQTPPGHQTTCAQPCGDACCDPTQTCEVATSTCVTSCTPACTDRDCGPDGCGGTCGALPLGECQTGYVCANGVCTCAPQCDGRECGLDGCAGYCGGLPLGECPAGESCVDGLCVPGCVPACAARECGPDGCGGFCGASPLGECPAGSGCTDGICVAGCLPDCLGKQCGPDGCGGECGDCWSWVCNDEGMCVRPCSPVCTDRECGPDACGGFCGPLAGGACPAGHSCNGDGQCIPDCVPQCTGRMCGPDGCGGSCPPGCMGRYQACDGTGQCYATCTPVCDGKECGPDGCGGECEPGCSVYAACGGDGRCDGSINPCPALPIPSTCFNRTVIYREWGPAAVGDGTYFAHQAPYRLGFNRTHGAVWIVKFRVDDNSYQARLSAYGDSVGGIAWLSDSPCDPQFALDHRFTVYGNTGGGTLLPLVVRDESDAQRLMTEPQFANYAATVARGDYLRGGHCYYIAFENADWPQGPLTADWFTTVPDYCGSEEESSCYYLAFDFFHYLDDPISGARMAGSVINGLTH